MGESPIRARAPIADADAVELLRTGDLKVLGRLPWSSNATFLVDVSATAEPGAEAALPEAALQAVYKPARGERPLHDFPPGLHRREVAAYELSVALGWDLVPPTVVRDGPLGEGSLQLFVLADFEQHYFTLRERPELQPALRRLCAFDVVANATDRKGGHVLLEGDDHIWAIDNGLCFHAYFKLRTVLWDFSDEPLPTEIRRDLAALCRNGPPAALVDLLEPEECEALTLRTEALLSHDRFPTDPTGRRWPWPPV